MSAIEALRADVKQVIADHPRYEDHVRGGVWCQHAGHYQFFEQDADYEAHVSERVMAMLAEKWGLREDVYVTDTERTRLVTDWRTDDTAREGGEG